AHRRAQPHARHDRRGDPLLRQLRRALPSLAIALALAPAAQAGTIRVALPSLPWPLDPARLHTRDEQAVGRALLATPLRVVDGKPAPGLCTLDLRCGRWTKAVLAQLRRPRIPVAVRRVYWQTADRADYQALVPEYAARPALGLVPDADPARTSPSLYRAARSAVGRLPHLAVRIAAPPELRDPAEIVASNW